MCRIFGCSRRPDWGMGSVKSKLESRL
ncbi:MAG: DUF3553 domain-containing protein [Clostridiales bacterium]|nr:DUF3553 domain-containing protein [Clostridiales bacterium]